MQGKPFKMKCYGRLRDHFSNINHITYPKHLFISLLVLQGAHCGNDRAALEFITTEIIQ
jgi:hypothetical protein